MGGEYSTYGLERGVYSKLVVKPEGKRSGGSRRRWENNIRIDLQEVGCECENWIGLAHDRTGGGRL
jgi:hypothetical protein